LAIDAYYQRRDKPAIFGTYQAIQKFLVAGKQV
jgi:hypothetical protein